VRSTHTHHARPFEPLQSVHVNACSLAPTLGCSYLRRILVYTANFWLVLHPPFRGSIHEELLNIEQPVSTSSEALSGIRHRSTDSDSAKCIYEGVVGPSIILVPNNPLVLLRGPMMMRRYQDHHKALLPTSSDAEIKLG